MEGKGGGVLEDARDVVEGDLGEVIGRFSRVEGVFIASKQRLMGVHPAAVFARDWLGHECGVNAVLPRYLPDNQPIRHAVVGHGKGVRVAQDDFVLAGGHLMVAVLGLYPPFPQA